MIQRSLNFTEREPDRWFVSCRSCEIIDVFDESEIQSQSAIDANNKAKELATVLEQTLSDIRFKILVWGPTPAGGTPESKKRNDIYDDLKPNHDVNFSEETCVTGSVPVNLQEAIEVTKVHLVVCVASSFGSIGEAHEILVGKKENAIVWFREKIKSSFGNGLCKTLRDSGTVVEFYDDKILDCCAVKSVSLFWVKNKLHLKAYAENMKKRANAIDPTVLV